MSIRSFSSSLALVGALLAAAVVTAGCGNGEAPATAEAATQQRPATRVETLVLEPTSFTDEIELTGTVEAVNDATLSAQATGTVMSIVELGTAVQEGERIAQLDATEAQAALEQAQARYELTQDRYERQEPLYRDSIITALEFEQVRSERTQARAALAQAEKRLRNTRVTAPFAGTVEERFVQPGEQVAPNDPVARVIDVQPAKVVAGVPERYAGDIEKGNELRIQFQSARLGERTGTVTFVGSAIDPDSRTFTIEATIANADRTIKPEMVTQIRLDRTTIEDALVIPRPAVVRDEAGTHVYTLERTDSTAIARKRDIVLGPSTGARVAVESGLQAGDEVVVVGQTNLAPGQPVEVTDQYTRIPDAGTPYESSTASNPAS
jgi:RND family efflux transporter MFP subunit